MNGKYFVPPDDNPQEFKVLFQRLTAVGAGRSVDPDGLPQGPWTPDLLAEAITAIDANRKGIELRTVQLWFQDNRKGVSPENVRWLARIFGCDDPEATGDWQRELRASLNLLAENRRAARVQGRARVETGEEPITTPAEYVRLADRPRKTHRRGLAGWSERIFGLGGPLNLPASIFAGATALQFAAFFIGNHSITYVRADGIEKQVGFHWATNWTFLFMLFLPLFVIFAGDLVSFWRSRGRAALLPDVEASNATEGWVERVRRSSATFWAVLLICIVFAGLMQWIGARMLPLRAGVDEDDIDWASVALVRPDNVTIPEAVMFSGLAYFYMAVCFYLMFAGLILLYTLADDFWANAKRGVRPTRLQSDVARRILNGLLRCSISGMFVAICMTLQNRFLPSDAIHVWAWLFGDIASLWRGSPPIPSEVGYGFNAHYISLIIALPTCAVMIYGVVRIGIPTGQNAVSFRMAAALLVIVAAYLMIGAFPGFTVLLAVAALVGIYGMIDPGYGISGTRKASEGRRV